MTELYNLTAYGHMIADDLRMAASIEALRRVVTPNSIFLDIGTGPGVFALVACLFGAKRVYAIDPSQVIQIGRDLAAANGFSDRIEFIQDYSTNIDLPDKADVIFADIRGVVPLYRSIIPTFVDARSRLLKPGGVLLPQQDVIWATLVDSPDLYESNVGIWGDDVHGIDMSAARQVAANIWTRGRILPEQELSDRQRVASLDYATVEDPNLKQELTWTIQRQGTLNGLVMWFDGTIFDDITISNAPELPEMNYGNLFFPMQEPVDVTERDVVTIKVQANLVGEDYTWRWDTHIQNAEGRSRAKFHQSTFFGTPLAARKLAQVKGSHMPSLNDEGEINRFVLNRVDGETSLEVVAQRLLEQFPDRFAHQQEALTRVAQLAYWYGS